MPPTTTPRTRRRTMLTASKFEDELITAILLCDYHQIVNLIDAQSPSLLQTDDNRGWTAIHAAVMTQPDRTLETFGSVDLRDIQAGSASRVNEHIIRMLWVANKQCIHSRTRSGDTALHLACLKGDAKIVKCLLDLGVRKNEANAADMTAFEVAVKSGFWECAKLVQDSPPATSLVWYAQRPRRRVCCQTQGFWGRLCQRRSHFIFFVIFVGCMTWLAMRAPVRGHDGFFMTLLMRDKLLQEEFKLSDSHVKKVYRDIGEVSELWHWMQGPLVDTLSNPDWLLERDDTSDSGFIHGHNRIVGAVRLRQVRMQNSTCPEETLFADVRGTCFPSLYGAASESKEAFGPNDTWRWRDGEALGGFKTLAPTWSAIGIEQRFPDSGFAVDLPTTQPQLSQQVAFLRDNRFIDRHTRVLLVTLNTYNMNAEAWSVMSFQADLPPTGGTVMTVRTSALRAPLFSSSEAPGLVAAACIGFVAYVIYFVFYCAQGLKSARKDLRYQEDLLFQRMFPKDSDHDFTSASTYIAVPPLSADDDKSWHMLGFCCGRGLCAACGRKRIRPQERAVMYMIRRGRTNQAVDIVKALRGTEDAVNVTYKDMCGNSIEDYVARELELLGPARAQQLIGAERWKEGRLVRTRKRRCLHAATSLCRGRRCVVVVCRGPGTLLSTVTAVIQGVLLVIVAALLIAADSWARSALNGVTATTPEFVNMHPAVHLTDVAMDLLAVTATLSWLGVIPFLIEFPTVGLLGRVLAKMANDIWVFMVVFVIYLMGFALAFHVVFGHVLPEYSDLFSSMLSLFRSMFGDINFDAMAKVDRVMAPMLTIAHLLVAGIIFVNILIAMLTNRYEEVSQSAKEDYARHVFGEYYNAITGMQEEVDTEDTGIEPSKIISGLASDVRKVSEQLDRMQQQLAKLAASGGLAGRGGRGGGGAAAGGSGSSDARAGGSNTEYSAGFSEEDALAAAAGPAAGAGAGAGAGVRQRQRQQRGGPYLQSF